MKNEKYIYTNCLDSSLGDSTEELEVKTPKREINKNLLQVWKKLHKTRYKNIAIQIIKYVQKLNKKTANK